MIIQSAPPALDWDAEVQAPCIHDTSKTYRVSSIISAPLPNSCLCSWSLTLGCCTLCLSAIQRYKDRSFSALCHAVLDAKKCVKEETQLHLKDWRSDHSDLAFKFWYISFWPLSSSGRIRAPCCAAWTRSSWTIPGASCFWRPSLGFCFTFW